MNKQLLLDVHNKLIVDLFAGGGGMSVAFENAFGRSPDIAINHNDDALSMHRMNHPLTRHFIADVYEVDPHGATQGREVGWLHLSPDCTHHSQASGGQPRSKKIRGLSWVGYRWGGQVQPDVISLENVKQILKWGPLIAKRCKVTRRVMKLDGTIAAPGEIVPVREQYLVPDPKREGQTWHMFVAALQRLGYKVEWRTLVAANFGGHTTRERLFMIARRDGLPITWPETTHFKKPVGKQKKWKPAADCIDFSDLGKSIFTRPKPLAPATLRRIAKGMKRYVIDSIKPFIVPIAHYNGTNTVHSIDEPLRTITSATKGGEFAVATPIIAKFRHDSAGRSIEEPMPTVTSGGDCARPAGAAHALGLVAPVLVPATHQGADRVHSVEEPLKTITAAHRGETMLAAPVLVQAAHGEGTPGKDQRWGEGSRDIEEPLPTITGSGGQAIATAYMMQANDGFNTTVGRELSEPMTTITNSGSQQQLVTAHLAHLRGNCDARDLDDPLQTVSAGGQHHGLVSAFLSSYYTDDSNRCRDADDPMATITTENRIGLVECVLSPEEEAGALRVAAFLMEYYSEGGQWSELDKPLNTITTKDRLALVTVFIQGTPYVIVDIRLRMLKPRELFNGQDFPPSYIIDRGHDGRRFSISAQVRMCGNSVDPAMATSFLAVNAPWLAVMKAA
jgi:DNA (cytosine-5)-methyltransferase 1